MNAHESVSAKTRPYNDGFAVPFKLPDVGYELIGAELRKGFPYFIFARTHHKVSTLTEEDFAVCARLVQDGKRPGFFYRTFLPGHPFCETGRLYQLYDPPYLRGTSVGKTLADADWIMKCQHVGVRSNEEKTQFWLWNDGSELATRIDFRENAPGTTIMMECKSVQLIANNNKVITFDVDEPKMQIRSVLGDEVNSAYSNYMTDNYDSVAYDHAPVYYKVKEIIKLMLCQEWMKDKGVQFSKRWVMKNAVKSKPSPLPQMGPVKSSTQIPPQIVEDLTNQLMREDFLAKENNQFPYCSPAETNCKIERHSSGNSFLLKLTTKIGSGDVEYIREIRATQSDFDFLCEGIDPNTPVDYYYGTANPYSSDDIEVIPGVESWAELHAETVPQPSKWLITQDGYESMPIVGGVSTNNIPVHTRVPSAIPEKAQEKVKIPVSTSSKARAPIKINGPEQPSVPVVRPTQHYQVNSAECRRNQAIARSGIAMAVGCSAGRSAEMFTREGQPVKKVEPVYIRKESKTIDKGRIVDSTIQRSIEVYKDTKEKSSIHPPAVTQPQPNEKGSPSTCGSEDSGHVSVDQHMAEPPGMEVDQPVKGEEDRMIDSGIMSPNSDLQSFASESPGTSSGEEFSCTCSDEGQS